MYHYWVLRYVPNAVREEFVNVGVIVGSDRSEDWAIRRVYDLARANRLGGDPKAAEDWLLGMEQVVRPSGGRLSTDAVSSARTFKPSQNWLDQVYRQERNNFRVSEAKPVKAVSAAEAADKLFDTLVAVSRGPERSRARSEVVRELYARMRTRVPSGYLQRQVKLATGAQQVTVEFAVGTSHIAQLAQVWSFDVRHPEPLVQRIQASNYVMARLRQSGGQIVNSRHYATEVDQGVALRVLYVPPVRSDQDEVFRIAQEGWRALDLQAYPQGQEDEVAAEAERLLSAS